MQLKDGKLVSDDVSEVKKETVSKFNMSIAKSQIDTSKNNLSINQEEFEHFKNEALSKLAGINKDSKPPSQLDKVINLLSHVEAIIKLVSPHFANSKERVVAKKKIRSYFESKS